MNDQTQLYYQKEKDDIMNQTKMVSFILSFFMFVHVLVNLFVFYFYFKNDCQMALLIMNMVLCTVTAAHMWQCFSLRALKIFMKHYHIFIFIYASYLLLHLLLFFVIVSDHDNCANESMPYAMIFFTIPLFLFCVQHQVLRIQNNKFKKINYENEYYITFTTQI